MAKISVRVGAIALAPTIALVGFASLFAMGHWARYDAGAQLRDETAFAVAAGALVHDLQVERGLTTWHLRSGDPDSSDLAAARIAVDRSMARVRGELKGASSGAGAHEGARGNLLNATDDVVRLRGEVARQAISSQAAFARYTVIVEQGLSAIADVSRTDAGVAPDIAQALRILSAIAVGKEFAGRERALGAAALTAPVTRATEAAEVARLEGAQSGAFAAIDQSANTGIADQWARFNASPEEAAVVHLRHDLFDRVGQTPNITPATWFGACTARIELLHELEAVIASDVLAGVSKDMAAALRDLVIALAFSVVSVAGAVAIALGVARSITRPLEKLTETTVNLASGHLETPIEADPRHDEIAALQNALQIFRDGLLANQRLTRQLADADRQTSLGALAAGMAHEVNTPIGNALMVASSLALGLGEFRSEIMSGAVRRSSISRHLATSEEAVRLLSLNLERAAEQIASFKKLSVDQARNDCRVLDLKETIEDAVRSCTPSMRKAEVRTELDLEEDIALDSYPGAVSQVIVNLLENAIKHGLPSVLDGCVTIRAYRNGNTHACITVSDNGIGIPDELRDKVFNAFFTTRAESGGTGLGLHIVKSVVTGQLGGTVELLRSETGGACFVIAIPLRAPQYETQSTPESGASLVHAA